MILSFLYLAEVIHIGQLKLHNGREIFQSKPILLGNNKNGWYFINIINSSRINFLLNLGVEISTRSFMNPQWICAFLNTTQIERISPSYYISEVLPSDKIRNEKLLLESSKYLIYAHESFNPPPNSNIQKIYKNYYVSKSYSPHILEDRSILELSPYESPKLLNRFSRGTTQQEKFNVEFNGSLIIPNFPLYEHGITGDGQTVTIIDSGLDYRSCFFKDQDHDPPVNVTNFFHRKIVRYEPFADASDASHGHGTHVSGTVAGYADCHQCDIYRNSDDQPNQCAISLYNGHAPGAKIYFIDAGYVSRPNDLDAEYDMEDVIRMSRLFGGHIFSCSWGYPPSQNEKVRLLYDQIGFDNPDFIFFFGAGNTRKKYDIYAPANSKNIMAVGGINKPEANSRFSNINSDIYLELEKSKERTVCDFTDNDNLFIQKTTTDPLLKFIDQVIGEKFILVKDENDCDKADSIEESASLFITNNRNIRCQAFKKVPRCLIDEQFANKITNGLKASLVIDFISEKYGPTYGIAGFTSTGPSTIGLVKPDILTPGADILSAAGNTIHNSPPICTIEGGTRSKGGTSMATPAAAGATALLAQYIEDGYYPYGKRSKLNIKRSKYHNFSNIEENGQKNSKINNQKSLTYRKARNNHLNVINSRNEDYQEFTTDLKDEDSLTVTMPLLKALITNGAGTVSQSTTVPDCNKGFGVMHIADALLFSDETEKMKEFGLRISSQDFVVTGESKEEFISEIKLLDQTSTNKPLVLTLTWLDPPTSGEREKLPIYADLDLFIECPDGKIIFGNQIQNNIEEMYSTTERITINNPKGGIYKIHVTSPKLPKTVQISPVVVVNGPFNHLDFTANPKFIKFAKQKTDRKCQFNKTGHLCQHDVTEIKPGESLTFSLKYRIPKFFCTFFDGNDICISTTNGISSKILDVTVSKDQIPKFGGQELYFTTISKSTSFIITKNMVPKNTYIYLTFCELVNNDVSNIILNVKKTTPESTTPSISPSSSASISFSPIISPSSIPPSSIPPSSIPPSSMPPSSIPYTSSSGQFNSPTQSFLPSPSQSVLFSNDQTISPTNDQSNSDTKSSELRYKFACVILCCVVIYLVLAWFISYKCTCPNRNDDLNSDDQTNEKTRAENQAFQGLLAQPNAVL